MTVDQASKTLNLIQGNAFNEIKKVASNSVHLICTDPPYFISKKTNFKNGKGNQKKYGSISMEFGDWDLKKNSINWFSLMQEFKRILVPGGTMVIFYDIFKLNDIAVTAEKLNLKQPRIGFWEKTNPVPINARINYLSNSREYFISYTKGTKRTFNSYYDRAYYEAPIVSGKIRFHPCQKPVSVLEKVILTHTNEGDTVLDCFMGSGSTGEAAINLNRKFIGVELDDTYFNRASAILHNVVQRIIVI